MFYAASFPTVTINHDERRARIASTAIDVIAHQGLGAATIRRIAAEGRWSTAAVTRYFPNKQKLLLATFQQLSELGEEQFSAIKIDDEAVLIEALKTMVAWCPANVRRWRAYLAFWDRAARDHDLAAIINRSTHRGLEMIGGALAAVHAGAEPGAIDKAAQLLNSVVQGISLQAIVAPEDWPADRVDELLRDAVALASTDLLDLDQTADRSAQ